MKTASRKIFALLMILTLTVTMCISITEPVSAKSPSKYTWKEKTAPNYVVKVGKAKVKNKPKKGKIKYSKLDKYGRTGRVVGNITYKMVKKSAGWREEFAPGSDPSGWGQNQKVAIQLYNGRTYHGYLWNRSHLIADSLGGKAIRKNLITGTRMQNVGANDGKGGMAYSERKVVDYLYKHHKASVYYSATPVYKKKEKIPRSVIVDFKSSDGKLNERVIVYNAAKGFKLDYKKGMKGKTVGTATATATEPEQTQPPAPAASSSDKVYVTKSGKRYHLATDCSGLEHAASIAETTKDAAKSQGKTLCAICAERFGVTE